MKPTSPSENSANPVSFTILSNGNSLDNYDILSLRINQLPNGISNAEIVLIDGELENGFEKPSTGIFDPDKKIEIKLGYYGQKQEEQTVFIGYVISHQMIYKDGFSTLTINCKNEDLLNFESELTASDLVIEWGNDVFEMDIKFELDSKSNKFSKYSGFATFQGSSKAKVNTTIEIKNLGNNLNEPNLVSEVQKTLGFKIIEPYLISEVEHIIKEGNWLTKINLDGNLNPNYAWEILNENKVFKNDPKGL